MTDHAILYASRTWAKSRSGCERHDLDAAVNAATFDADVAHCNFVTVMFHSPANLPCELIDYRVNAPQRGLNLVEASEMGVPIMMQLFHTCRSTGRR